MVLSSRGEWFDVGNEGTTVDLKVPPESLLFDLCTISMNLAGLA